MDAIQSEGLPKSKSYSKLPLADEDSASVTGVRKRGCSLQLHAINE